MTQKARVTHTIDISEWTGTHLSKDGVDRSTIRRIQQESGARLVIDKEAWGTFIKVTGMPQAVAWARKAVELLRSLELQGSSSNEQGPSGIEQGSCSAVIRRPFQDNNAHSKKDAFQNAGSDQANNRTQMKKGPAGEKLIKRTDGKQQQKDKPKKKDGKKKIAPSKATVAAVLTTPHLDEKHLPGGSDTMQQITSCAAADGDANKPRKKNIGDPNKPKRARTAYNFFLEVFLWLCVCGGGRGV